MPHVPFAEAAASQPQPFVPAHELQRVVQRLRGVYTCRIVRDGGEALPRQVRVVVHGNRRLSIAKDIQSAWFALWGLYVPHGSIVVTGVRQLADLPLAERRFRLRLLRFEHRLEHVTAMVSLDLGASMFEGRATQSTPADGCRLAAEAMVDALRAMLPADAHPALLDVRVLPLAGRATVAVAVGVAGCVLPGICAVTGDPRQAAVCAVLQATNRLRRAGEVPAPARRSASIPPVPPAAC